jgi:aryl-alcohol dehydrogenase-like predicted oxidoreductase
MHFGGATPAEEARAMVDDCLEAGVNHFDCANVYVGGEAEVVLGRLLAPVRDEVVIATKCGFPVGKGPNDHGTSALHVRRAVEGSLRRLGTDRIDLLYLHRFDGRPSMEQTLSALDRLVTSGEVTYVGVSNWAAWQVATALGTAALQRLVAPVAIQPMYNLAKRQAEVEILPLAEHAELAVFPYSPLGGGLFTGRYRPDQPGAEGRLNSDPRYRTRYASAANFDAAAEVAAVAAEAGIHPATLAMAWVGSHPAVTAPLIGARTREQLGPALAAADLDLDPALRDRLSALTPTPPPANDRNEEQG